ncbi:unnamed protein product, partial [Symbiodinium microadriaticum]
LQYVNGHERDKHLLFDHTTHSYFWKNTRVRESVTQLIHRHAEGFDADQALKHMSQGDRWPRPGYLRATMEPDVVDKISRLPAGPRILASFQQANRNEEELCQQVRAAVQQGSPQDVTTLQSIAMSSSEIKMKWTTARDEAAQEGTWMHAQFECLLNGGSVQEMTPEIALLFKFLGTLQEVTAYRTEWKIYADDMDVAGSIDFVVQQADGCLVLVDWKRSSRIASRGDHFNRFMRPPLTHLPDSTLAHYHLQLNVYRWILQRHYHQVVTEMYIVGTHPDNGQEPWVQQVDILDHETAKLVGEATKACKEARKRKGEELLRIFNMAGEELLEITLKEPETASAVKRQVQTRTGLPRFRQRLLGHNGPLGDADMVSAPADLQLIKLDYAPTNRQDTVQMIAAARSPTPARLEQLLSRPLDPNCAQATFFSTTTPLEAATKGRRSENIKLLLEARVNANTDEDHGLLLRAAQRQDQTAVQLLIAAQCNLETRNHHGTTALAAAARKSNVHIVQMLLQAKADMEAANNNRRKPLALAAWGGEPAIVLTLLAARCNPLVAEPRHPDAIPASTAKDIFLSACLRASSTAMREALLAGRRSLIDKPNLETREPTPARPDPAEPAATRPRPSADAINRR